MFPRRTVHAADRPSYSQFEASRLVMIQILLHNLKMDPLVSLHYYAPVCAAINLCVLPFTEGLAPFYELQKLGVGVLLTNASVAFFLNVAAVFLVGVGSGLVLTLADVFKVRSLFFGVLVCGGRVHALMVLFWDTLCGVISAFLTSILRWRLTFRLL